MREQVERLKKTKIQNIFYIIEGEIPSQQSIEIESIISFIRRQGFEIVKTDTLDKSIKWIKEKT